MSNVLTVGAGKQYSTIAAAVQAAQSGDTVRVDSGTYTNEFLSFTKDLTIESTGGMAKLLYTQNAPNGLGMITETGKVTLRGLEIDGSAVKGDTSAGVFFQGGDLTVDNSYIHDNNRGVQGAAGDKTSTITITNSEIASNYNNAGGNLSHNIFAGDIAKLDIENSYIHDGKNGHEIKSYAENTILNGDRIYDNSGSASYTVDIPNGGTVSITNSVIDKGANSGNPTLINIGEEGNLHASSGINISGNKLITDQTGHTEIAINNQSGTSATVHNNVSYGYDPNGLVVNGAADSSGNTASNGHPVLDMSTMGPPPPPQPQPGQFATTWGTEGAVVANGTVITVGAGKMYANIQDAVAAAHDGDTVRVDAGTYNLGSDQGILINSKIILTSVGGMVNLVNTTNYPLYHQASIIVNTDATIVGFEISGNKIDDNLGGNAAGIRYHGGNLTLNNCYIHDNNDGILGGPDNDGAGSGSISIFNSEIANNGNAGGSASGYVHNVYIGDIGSLTIDNSYIHDAIVGHDVKSRAENTTIINSVIGDSNGNASYTIDFPNGGNVVVENNLIQKGVNSQNPNVIAYGEEGNVHSNSAILVSGNTINDLQQGHTPVLVWNAAGSNAIVSNNQLYGATSSNGPVTESNNTVLSSPATFGAVGPWHSPAPEVGMGNGHPVTLALEGTPQGVSVPAPPAPPAPPGIAYVNYGTEGAVVANGTVITVGAGKMYANIQDAVAAAHDGDTVRVDAGTYNLGSDQGILINSKIILTSVGGMVNLVNTTDYPLYHQASIIVNTDATIVGFEISGNKISDDLGGNAAGIRYHGGNLTLNNCYIHDNNDGILGGPDNNGATTGSIGIFNSEISHNGNAGGSASGYVHNVYIGDIGSLTIENSYVHDAVVGHEVKSRAENTVVKNSVIADNNNNASYSIDLPNGGNALIQGNTLQKGANSQNGITINFGEEGNVHNGSKLVVDGNGVDNDLTAHNMVLVQNATSASASLINNHLYGVSNQTQGNVSASGNTAVSSEIAYNSSAHPWQQAFPDVGHPSGSAPAPTPTPAPTPAPIPTPAPTGTDSLWLTDINGHQYKTAPVTTTGQTLKASDTHLDQQVTETVGSNGVITIATPVWNDVRIVNVHDTSGHSYATNAFMEADFSLAGAKNGSLLLTNAKRGVIDLSHDGNYHVTINAHSNGADQTVNGKVQHLNDFVVSLGSGENSVTLRGDSMNTHGVFNLGSGHAVILGAAGGNSFEFGSGRAEVTGGAGSDHYAYHANSGVSTIQNFDSTHDTLAVDASLKASMHTITGAEGTTLMFGSTAHEIVLHAIQNFDTSHINWV